MTPPIDLILARLGRPRRAGRGWSARCPAHDDRHASLSVSEGGDGRVFLHCHAGCTTASVVGALGLRMSDLFPADGRGVVPRPSSSSSSSNGRAYAAVADAVAELWRRLGRRSRKWVYRDAAGHPVGVVVCWDMPTGKTIRPIARHADGWRIG